MKIRILKQQRIVDQYLNFLVFLFLGGKTQIEKYLESLEASGSAWSSYILAEGKANKKSNNGLIKMLAHDTVISESKH